jgi:hypothetical protein
MKDKTVDILETRARDQIADLVRKQGRHTFRGAGRNLGC